jgi:YidC/Oxa1 family membrane protein insertase
MDLFDIIGWLWTHGLVIPMTNVLVMLAHASFGSFGIAIIIFTILMRGITWPLQQSQFKSMRAMQEVQPRVQEIQKKYKDPQRRSEETMKLYREAGVNPLGCIWPLLIQFPIWIALYQTIRFALGTTPEALLDLSQRLYPWSYLHEAVPLESHFLWMDLGQPDPTFLMAILVGGSTWVQQRMMTPSTAPDPQQQSINNTMQLMMPLMLAYFTLTFPSGLALYWVATNIIGVALQYFYMGRQLDWRRIFTLNPAGVPAPSAARQPAKSPEPSQGSSEPVEESDAAEQPASQPKRRRRRRGRRRR